VDHRTFDTLAKGLAQGRNRRSLLKGLLGLGGAVAAGTAIAPETDAARRGYAGPVPKSSPTVVPGPGTCDPQTCYGCKQCQGGVCIDNPKDNCYDHTDECLGAVCNPDGGCSYPFDCRVRDGCCTGEQVCNQTSGHCECLPNTCCGVECPGCQTCEKGVCVRDDANCYVHTEECLASVCNADGSCSYPFDCGVRDNCCPSGETCDTSTGACVKMV
jgi:hypothetical protein